MLIGLLNMNFSTKVWCVLASRIFKKNPDKVQYPLHLILHPSTAKSGQKRPGGSFNRLPVSVTLVRCKLLKEALSQLVF